MVINKCRCCGSDQIRQFFDLGDQPFANALLDQKDFSSEKKYPLSLSYCEKCSLVQLDYTADPEELFSNYFWVTGTSETAKKYAEKFCLEALSRIEVKEDAYVLEIASNDGTFLKSFKNKQMEVLGIDAAKNIAEQAIIDGIPTLAKFFDSSVAQEVIAKKGYPAIVYARNVVPHVANLHNFLEGFASCCNETNIGIVEVHYAGVILEQLHYDSIYHEHLCYFTLKSLRYLFEIYGLHIYDIMESPISGGSIVVYMSKVLKEKTNRLEAFEKKEAAGQYNTFDMWSDFAKKADEHRTQFKQAIKNAHAKNQLVIGYGASARSSTMLNFCEIDQNSIPVIIDQNILKQGKYTPGTHILIQSAEEVMKKKPDVVVLLAWNFKEEIIHFLKEKYGFCGSFIIPLPFPVMEVIADDV